MTTGFDWLALLPWPLAPPSLGETLTAFEQRQRRVADIVRGLPDEALFVTIKFITDPKTITDVPRIQILWLMLHDQIHHRGQFSIYLRMAEGKVPSIYGQTADEPWM